MVFGKGQKLEEVVAVFEILVDELLEVGCKQINRATPTVVPLIPLKPGFMKINTDVTFKRRKTVMAVVRKD